jgi:signal peptidase I
MAGSRRKSNGFSETLGTLVQVALIALAVRSFLYEPFFVPSKSMMPTLLAGDWIVVSKYSYGYSRYSLPFNLHLFDGRIFSRPPRRGDVVVFRGPANDGAILTKRLVGLPGDHIRVQHRALVINGQPVKRQEAENYIDRDVAAGPERHTQFVETLANGQAHAIIEEQGAESAVDNTDEYVVPPHHYFMMGDNRDNSEDSRFLRAVGYVPEENLVGRAEIIFLSTRQTDTSWKFWRWPGNLRWSRFFLRIV